jgi:hypothetical protein
VVCVWPIYACILISLLFLPALDSNDTEGTEEGEVFEYQGQADQGKPSKLGAYLILVLLIACFINVYENACLHIAITSL